MKYGDGLIQVLTAPLIDPASGRIDINVPDGLTLREIVGIALPALGPDDFQSLRVALVTERGSELVDPRFWSRVKPRPGVHVVIRVVPGKNALRSILSIVVAVAATALTGGAFAGFLGTTLGIGVNAANALITLGVTALGNLAINALIPPPDANKNTPENRYSIAGWRNRVDPDGAIPVVLGKMRYAPPFAARSYTEIVGDFQYVRSLFVLGDGELALSDFKIGETSLADYQNVDIEVRDGLVDDLPVRLFPRQVVEEAVGTELSRLLPRDELGEVVPNEPGIETPIVRVTGAEAAGASVILAWPSGLVAFDNKGRKVSEWVSVRIENRLAGAELWQEVIEIRVVASKLETFYRQHTWNFPSRGRWEVRVTMMKDENRSSQSQSRTIWAGLQTLRPEYPLNLTTPVSVVALRIKASYQLNGQLDNFNLIAERLCLDWDVGTGTWVKRATSNPASLFRYVLQSSANPKPVADEDIDLEQLAEWHDFCRTKDLKYDRVIDTPDTTLRDVLTEVAAAGRASPRHDGIKWGVTIDRPSELVVDHINPRNSSDFTVTRSYFEPPHGIRVKFTDASNNYEQAQRLVRWPGYEGEMTLTEQMEMIYKTDADEVYRETIRRMYEALYRPDIYQAMQDGPARVATRGDLVMLSHHVIDTVQVTGRVTAVQGRLIELDELVTIEEGIQYAIRFRNFAETADFEMPDTIGSSIVSLVSGTSGETSILTLNGTGPVPKRGDLVHFGPSSEDSLPLIVSGIEAAEESASVVRMVDAAPIIDDLVDALEIPAWSGRVGAEIDENFLLPSAPRFSSVVSRLVNLFAYLVEYRVEPGSGIIAASSYEIDHRLNGSDTWDTITIPAASGGGEIDVYSRGLVVQMRVRSISASGSFSPYSPVVTLTVGANDAGIPIEMDESFISVTPLLGGMTVSFATSDDVNTTSVQIYRSRAPTLDRETDASGVPLAVELTRSYVVPIGDATRLNLLEGAYWALGADWSASGSDVVHADGDESAVGLPIVTEAGKHYRLAFRTSEVSAGTLTPRLAGGSLRVGTSVSTNGRYLDRLQAVTGNDTLEWLASSDFVGTLSEPVAFVETAACLEQGIHYVWLEPRNEDDVAGPTSGPFEVLIV